MTVTIEIRAALPVDSYEPFPVTELIDRIKHAFNKLPSNIGENEPDSGTYLIRDVNGNKIGRIHLESSDD